VTAGDAPAEEPAARHWVIVGRVQGVGFRWFVLKHAQALGIRGWVRNTHDGSVEVLGVAAPATLDLFDARLAAGPPGAYVLEIRRSDVPHEIVDGKSFTIKH